MGWVTSDAPTKAELAACVECGLCLPHCPTFRLTGLETASPRGRLAAMAGVAAGVLPVDGAFEETMMFCLQCRACEAVCPSLVPFGRAMEGARIELAEQRPARGRRFRHRIVGRWLASPGMVRAATAAAAIGQRVRIDRWGPRPARQVAGLRRLPLRAPTIRGITREPEAAPIATVGLLAGCVMDPWFAGVHEATIAVLVAAGYRVVVPGGPACCGALAAHDGAAAAARELAKRNVQAFHDVDIVVADAAGCSAHLKEFRHWADGGEALASRARDVTELVAEAIAAGRLPAVPASGGRVAIQDPCHLRHAQRIIDPPRQILRAAGYEVVEIDPDALCCGAAGIYSVLRPDAAAELGRRKADRIRATGIRLVASANPGCEMQIRSHLGEGYRVAHPVELYARAISAT